MPALSIRAPWWWFILYWGKDVENRVWQERNPARYYRGPAYIHAALGCTPREFDEDCMKAYELTGRTDFPDFNTMHRGGLVGTMHVDDFVLDHPSPWFFGPGAIVISQVEPIEFVPCRGSLGFFIPPIFANAA